MKVNLNDSVLVRLTDKGKALAIEGMTVKDGSGQVLYEGEHMLDTCHPEWPDGRRRFRLWEVCRYLGPGMNNGLDNVIETEIEFL